MKEVGLERLLSPLGVDAFFENYYEQCAVHLQDRSVEKVYPGFPTVEDFEEILWAHEASLERKLRVNKDGKYRQPPHRAQGKDVFRWAIDQYADGCTLILNGMDTLSASVARLTRSIEAEMKGKVAANAFFTPASSQGFLPHFDTHDVFILQLAGQKTWRLFDQRIELPVDRQIHLLDQATVNSPDQVFELSPGDLLYVPRGRVHGPRTSGEHSLHITMGYRPLRWVDYLHALVDVAAEEEPCFRRSLRPRSAEGLSSGLPAILAAILEKSLNRKVRRKAMERCDESFNATLRPVPGGHVAATAAAERVEADSWVVRRPEALCHVYEVGLVARIQFPGIGLAGEGDLQPGSLQVPLALAGILRAIANSDCEFSARSLPSGAVTLESKLNLVRRLVKDGLLIPTR